MRPLVFISVADVHWQWKCLVADILLWWGSSSHLSLVLRALVTELHAISSFLLLATVCGVVFTCIASYCPTGGECYMYFIFEPFQPRPLIISALATH